MSGTFRAGWTADVRWTIRQSALEEMEAHARAESPRECCGVLIGLAGRVLEARRAANLSDDPNRFLVDPRAHVEALRETRRRELHVVGFYHSHPHSAPVPSPTRSAEASYPEFVYVIVGLSDARADARMYFLRGDHYVEVPMEAVAVPAPPAAPRGRDDG